MTNVQKIKEVITNLKWSEEKDGYNAELRLQSAKTILGLANGTSDKILKSAAFRVMNFARNEANA